MPISARATPACGATLPNDEVTQPIPARRARATPYRSVYAQLSETVFVAAYTAGVTDRVRGDQASRLA